jgi:hypothetical protein
MLADERTRTEVHHEWLLHSPAHESDVHAAWTEANGRRAFQEGHRGLSDVEFRCDGDDTIVIGYSVEGEPAPARRECTAHCGGVERDRDEWERRSGVQRATLLCVRDLAGEWSNSESLTYQAASHRLHELLDGPGAEPAEPGDWERRALAAEAKVARVAALAGSWSQYRDVALKSAGTDGLGELHIRPVREAADLLLAALADTEAGA